MRSAGARVAGEDAQVRVDARVRPWFLVLTDASPVAPVWTGAGVTLLLLGFLALVRLGLGHGLTFAPRGFPEQVGFQIQLFFCFLPGYMIAAMAYQERGMLRDLENLASGLPAPGGMAELRRELTHFDRARLVQAILIGLLVNVAMGFGARGELAYSRVDSVGLLPVICWLVMAPAIYIGHWQAAVFRRLGREVAVHLFDLRRQGVYARVGLRIVLVTGGGLALGAVFHTDWSGASLPLYFLVFVLIVWVPSSVALSLLPVWGIHRAIQVEKQAEQDRVLAAIAGDRSGLSGSALAAWADELRGVALLDYLEKVGGVREWPFDASALRRFGLYLLIPPLGWLGGALVERVVDGMLG